MITLTIQSRTEKDISEYYIKTTYLSEGDGFMRAWDDRNSFVRKTARQIRDLEIPDKCRDGLEKAGEVAKDGYEKAGVMAKSAYSKAKDFGVKAKNYDYSSAFGKLKDKICGGISFCSKKVKERNPIAVAVCVGVAAFAIFSLFFSIFYTIFSLGKKR